MEKIDAKKDIGITNEEIISIQDIVFKLLETENDLKKIVHYLVKAITSNPRLSLAILTNYVIMSEHFMKNKQMNEQILQEQEEILNINEEGNVN